MVMLELKEILVSLAARGIHIYVEDGKLKTKSEPGAITPEIASSIRENKEGLIALLGASAQQAVTTAEPIPSAPVADEHVLSFAQQRLWFLDQLSSGGASYNLPVALRLTGALDWDALQSAFDEIIRRHSILRTSYRKSQAGGVQVICLPQPLSITLVDLSAMTDSDQAEELSRLANSEATKPIDLSRDLMLRASVARLSSECHVLYLTLHHIAADGWSLGVLVKEFTALYEAFSQQQPSPLDSLEIQYVDFAYWQREHYSEERQEQELSFWRNTLRGIPQLHGLPLDKPRPPQRSTDGAIVRHKFDKKRLEAIKRFSNSRNVTSFMVLQSALALLIARWSDEDDVLIGTPVAGRVHPSTESLIGCFINNLVLRTTIDRSMNYSQLLERSKISMLDAYEFQHTPFEMLVESLNPERSLSHSPLFQVMFALQNYEVGSLELPGMLIEEVAMEERKTQFDMVVFATERSDGLEMTWEFATSLFNESTIASMASSFDILLQAILSDPDRNVLDLPLLSSDEQAALVEGCKTQGQGLLVLDSNGNVQPQGALGYVHAVKSGEKSHREARTKTRAKGKASAGPQVAGRTGKLGRLLPGGNVEIVGDSDSNLRLNRSRVATRHIEDALIAIEGIASAFVTVRTLESENATKPRAVVAYIVRSISGEEETGTSADQGKLLSQCRETLKARIPDFLVPKAFVIVDELPIKPDGRIDQEKLPEPEQIEKPQYVAPVHDLETKLCEIWCFVLSLDRVGVHDNFFEVGGTSMHSILVLQELEKLGYEVSITDLFSYPTIAGIVQYLQSGEQEQLIADAFREEAAGLDPQDAIAVIGLAGRFPDAPNVDAFWNNIKNGVESLRIFTDEELVAAGVDSALLSNPEYVKSGVVLDGIQEFDAGYFGFTPREAEVTDPQQRLLFECAVEALENAGYGDDTEKRAVAVYVGVSESRYLFSHLLPQSDQLEKMRSAVVFGNQHDYAATRLSYRLNLSGPSLSIGTACSTSLVAIHVACTSLLRGECEMALSGGSSLAQLDPQGYLFQEGSIASPDGHCRAFDSQAKGTRFGSGAGLVVLKRLQRALADGDTIHAVIKGSAINNDGVDKVGYTAPSVLGQVAVIREAQRCAGVDPNSIQYVEAHGTATELGDPIEVKALTKAFGSERRNYCGLGSVKPNVGHLDVAAGIAGFIKTVKALSERQIPPSINYHSPNPKIDFETSPFYVNSELRHWPQAEDGSPRRAGVSSFGIGGTNAHVVLEEAPDTDLGKSRHGAQLIVLSAKSETALAKVSSNLLEHLDQHKELDLADVAYTLQMGRAPYSFRRAFVANSVADAIAILREADNQQLVSSECKEGGSSPSVVFMFTGQGSQYVNMGRDLSHVEPVFKEIIDYCAELLYEEIQFDLRDILVPRADAHIDLAEVERRLSQTDVAQPALFALEYSIASMLIRWGVQPAAIIGHSLGEYVAACIAGVFSLEDGLRLVARRGRLMQGVSAGRMLSVQLGESEAIPLFDSANCCLAAINSEKDCVASGTEEAIDALAAMLEGRGVACRKLPTAHAFHSTMMEQIQEPFRRLFDDIPLTEPSLPYVSNLSGDFILPEQATDPDYWVRHMLGTVRFAEGVEVLATNSALLRPRRIFLEIGPGLTLCSLVRKNAKAQRQPIVSTVRHIHDARSDERQLLEAVGQIWKEGVKIDWQAFHEGDHCRRVPLPSYPFERKRYWIEKGSGASVAVKSGRAESPRDWFYAPSWTQLAPATAADRHAADELWLVFCDELGIGTQVCTQLESRGADVVSVRSGEHFTRVSTKDYICGPSVEGDYKKLLRDLSIDSGRPIRVIHLWSVGISPEHLNVQARFDRAQQVGLYSLLYLSQSLDAVCPSSSVVMDLVTDCVFSVTGEEAVGAEFSTTLGLCKVIPQEFPQLTVHHLDVNCQRSGEQPVSTVKLAPQLVSEVTSGKRSLHVALRGSKRWGLSYERSAIEAKTAERTIWEGGNYVITGGLGNIGLLLAEHLAKQGAAGLMLITRKALPNLKEWPELSKDDIDEVTSSKMDRLCQIESNGTAIRIYAGDVANYENMREAFDLAERELGSIDGVIHGAGKVHDAMLPLQDMTPAVFEEHFHAKVVGTHVLERIIEEKNNVGFCMLMSSLSSVLGGLGFGAYSSANSYLDAFVQRKHNEGDRRWFCVNWDGWIFTPDNAEQMGMSPEEGVEAFDHALLLDHFPQIINSTTALDERIKQWLHLKETSTGLDNLHPRPALQTGYIEPKNTTEKRLVAIWQNILGIEQIGILDNFFELGGDSVMLVQVHKAIRAELNSDVAVADLFQFPSIRELSRFLVKEEGEI